VTVVTAVALLRNVQILEGLDAASMERLAGASLLQDKPAGTLLFAAGEPCRGLFIVASGRVRIYRLSPDGREQVLHVEGPGRPVAELPLFDGGDYPASAVTIEDSRLLFVPRAEFERLYRDDPDVAQAVIRGLGRRLRHLVQLTQTLAFRDVAARLALLLAGYADRFGEPTSDGIVLRLDRTQEEIALEIGAARESVSRAMRQLTRKGLIRAMARDRLLIPQVERLRMIAAPGERARP
jgi:CRP-like cAMP-binding protein